jgi:hypothetical protein
MRGDEARLALHWWLRFEAGAGQRSGEPPSGFVLMNVTSLQLDDVDFSRLLDTRQVLGGQNCPLAQVGAQIVDQHSPDHVVLLCCSA